jgi:hypothetical protein
MEENQKKLEESVEFFTQIAEEAYIEHVSPEMRNKLSDDRAGLWKSGYLTAYIEFQKTYNTVSKN